MFACGPRHWPKRNPGIGARDQPARPPPVGGVTLECSCRPRAVTHVHQSNPQPELDTTGTRYNLFVRLR